MMGKNQVDIVLASRISALAAMSVYKPGKIPKALGEALEKPKGRPPTPISVSLVMTQANFVVEQKLVELESYNDFWRLCSDMIPRMRDLQNQLDEEK